MPKKDCLSLYICMQKYWRDYKLFRELAVLTSPMFAYLKREFVDECKSNSSTIGELQNRMASADHFVMAFFVFLTRATLPRELAIQKLLENDACMRAGFAMSFCFHCTRMCTIL